MIIISIYDVSQITFALSVRHFSGAAERSHFKRNFKAYEEILDGIGMSKKYNPYHLLRMLFQSSCERIIISVNKKLKTKHKKNETISKNNILDGNFATLIYCQL